MNSSQSKSSSGSSTVTLDPSLRNVVSLINTFTSTLTRGNVNQEDAITPLLEAYNEAGQPDGPPSPNTLRIWLSREFSKVIDAAYPESRIPGHEHTGNVSTSGGSGGSGSGSGSGSQTQGRSTR